MNKLKTLCFLIKNWKLQVIGLSPLREKQEYLMYSNTMGLLIKSIISFSIINTINKRIKSEREHHQISYHMLFLLSPTATICCWSKTGRRASILTIKDISHYRPWPSTTFTSPSKRWGSPWLWALWTCWQKQTGFTSTIVVTTNDLMLHCYGSLITM